MPGPQQFQWPSFLPQGNQMATGLTPQMLQQIGFGGGTPMSPIAPTPQTPTTPGTGTGSPQSYAQQMDSMFSGELPAALNPKMMVGRNYNFNADTHPGVQWLQKQLDQQIAAPGEGAGPADEAAFHAAQQRQNSYRDQLAQLQARVKKFNPRMHHGADR